MLHPTWYASSEIWIGREPPVLIPDADDARLVLVAEDADGRGSESRVGHPPAAAPSSTRRGCAGRGRGRRARRRRGRHGPRDDAPNPLANLLDRLSLGHRSSRSTSRAAPPACRRFGVPHRCRSPTRAGRRYLRAAGVSGEPARLPRARQRTRERQRKPPASQMAAERFPWCPPASVGGCRSGPCAGRSCSTPSRRGAPARSDASRPPSTPSAQPCLRSHCPRLSSVSGGLASSRKRSL